MLLRRLKIVPLCLSLVLCACQATSKPVITQNIGIAVYDASDTFIASLVKEIDILAQNDGLTTTMVDGQRQQINQNVQVKQLIADGSDILVVNMVDRTNTSTIINTAKKANVPVIFFNREPVESDLNRWNKLYYVGGDAYESGRLQGQIAASYIHKNPFVDSNQDGIIQYYVLEGEPGHQDTIIRSETSAQTIINSGVNIEKVGYSIANWQKDLAFKEMEDKIQAQTHIELIIANNDEMALGAIEAYRSLQIPLEKRPIIVGIDGTMSGLLCVESKEMIGTVYNDYQGQADAIYERIQAILHDSESQTNNLHKYTRLPYQKITLDNVKDFIKKK